MFDHGRSRRDVFNYWCWRFQEIGNYMIDHLSSGRGVSRGRHNIATRKMTFRCRHSTRDLILEVFHGLRK